MNSQAKFIEELARLNPAQSAAVENIEGPLLIVAGPGTGKTQTLALRLANILQKTQARPHNLLALTFTESGAIALKKRLASVIGSEAFGISAFTFHAFCARLHATFPSEFATTRERIPIDALRQIQVFREILSSGKFELLAPLRAPDLYLRDLSSALSNLKREGIPPERFRAILTIEQQKLSEQERINPRTKKPFGKILAAEKRLAKNFELADFYAKYQTALDEKGFTDFDDLILSVVDKLTPQISGVLTQDATSTDNFLLAYLQENFLYATVDEFQDTNGAQNAILKAWGSFDSKPNLCVVGDDDQSIYRFQGASLANILDFHENFPAAKIVTLTQNYRSTQKILAAADSVIAHNSERLVNRLEGISKNLLAENSAKNAPLPQIAFATSEADETAFVGAEIQKLIAAKIPLDEIAVIYRNRRHGDELAGFLQRHAIPFFRADGLDALQNFRVRQLVKFLKMLVEPRDALNSLASFFADFAGIPEVEVYKIAAAANFQKNFLDAALESENSAARDFATKILGFQKMRAEQNLLEFVENVVAGSGMSAKIAANKEFESAEALTTFLAFTKNFAISHDEPTLENLLDDLAAMRKNSLPIKTPSRAHAALTLTTAHAAKGLEWENVFVIHADDNSWGGRAQREMIKLPALDSASENSPEDDKAQKLEDERRLFFVALTRAKKRLTISVAGNYEFRELAPSRFLAEIADNLAEKIQIPSAEFASLPTTVSSQLSEDTQKFLASLLENYRLSPTGLNNFLACPRRFLLQNLLKIPTAVSVDERLGAIFGTAVHAAFEDFFREFKKTGQQPKLEIALAGLQRSLNHEPLTAAQRESLERDAKLALEKYLDSHSAELRPPLEVEFNFARHEVRLEVIPLTGKIDRIDAIPDTKNEVRFIDYKSMAPLTPAAIRGETANSTGDAYRQLLFYALLAELDSRFIFQARELVLSFVRPDQKGEFRDEKFSPQKAELVELEKTIREAWVKIQKLEFDCDDSTDCSRCSFRDVCGD